MLDSIKYLPDGTPVLVLGEAPARATSQDGGRTLTEVPQSLVALLQVTEVEDGALLTERPTYNADTGTWDQPGQETQQAAPVAPEGGAPVTPAPALTGDQIDAEIAKLQAEKAALGSQQAPQTN